jgi:ABC-type transport system involved in cytochrome c biogenesis permease subunit
MMKPRLRSLWIVTALAALVLSLLPGNAVGQSAVRADSWDPEVVQLFESLPVQDGGRIKPMYTYAGFMLLRIQGKRSIETLQDERLTPVEWLLDVLFYPEAAAAYPLFLVQNDEVVGSLGLSFEGKKKRDRYSLNELRPGIPRLFSLAREYSQIEEKDRTPVERQIYILAANVNAYLMLARHFDYARTAIEVPENEALELIFEGRSMVTVDQVLANMSALRAEYDRLIELRDAAPEEELTAIGGILQETMQLTEGTDFLALIPPVSSLAEEEEWQSPSSLFRHAFEHGSLAPRHGELLADLGALVRARDESGEFRGHMQSIHGAIVGLAVSRGEYEKVPLEVSYYKAKLLDYSQYIFVLSFLLMAFMWLMPKSKWLYRGTSLAVAVSTLLVIGAIVMRCMIRGRPPVSTLYETVLFVTAVGAVVALFIEAVNRQKIALSSAAILGMIGLFIANGYETLDKADTMPSLIAVLDTNFWLATHVTCITIGYSAGMLAALLASVYLLAKLVGFKRDERSFYRNIGRMVYGVLCFALIFSLVGTILGGIWANDSWGRFWGWDPKENGALLIVISQLVILHSRMGGYLREHGVCMATAFGGTVVAFSWWGVNLLGVGLHSYGFTSGIHTALWGYYYLQWGIVGLGGVAWLMERSRLAATKRKPAADERGAGIEPGNIGGSTA